MAPAYHLFERFGVELEYMIVDRETLDVRPIADEVLRSVAGDYVDEVNLGALHWSNELVTHVIELKTADPLSSMAGMADRFQDDVRRINQILSPYGACLLPTSAHPWMNPLIETKLWPHAYNVVYEAFDRIFGCRGHGWSNLQCTHINLPFADDEEFGRLHAAIRLVLPILPALAASSPVLDGGLTGWADSRMEVYRLNCGKIPSLTGRVIPEPVFTRRDYEEKILRGLYRDIAPHDPDGVLQYEWLNARGAIARFDRHTIEIRLLDIQECPQADFAILAVIVEVLRDLVAERWSSLTEQQAWSVDRLEPILLDTIRRGGSAVISDAPYLRSLGVEGIPECSAADLWSKLVGTLTRSDAGEGTFSPVPTILREGCLSHRIVKVLAGKTDRRRLGEVYGVLRECLAEGRMFHA